MNSIGGLRYVPHFRSNLVETSNLGGGGGGGGGGRNLGAFSELIVAIDWLHGIIREFNEGGVRNAILLCFSTKGIDSGIAFS